MKTLSTLLLLLSTIILQAQMTYNVGESVLNSPKKEQIIQAMDECVNYYNDYSNYTKNVYVYYNSGIPTAHASYNGGIGFGGSISGKTAMHEMSHVLGVGTYWNWDNKVGTKWLVDTVYNIDESYYLDSTKIKWAGDSARAQLHIFNGTTATLGCDKSHFWPYGLNYNDENRHHHVWMVGALRYDMGLSCTSGQGTGYRAIKMKLAQEDNAANISWSCDSAIVGGVIIERSDNGNTYREVYRTTDDNISSYIDSTISYGHYRYRMKRIVPWTNASQYTLYDMLTLQRDGDKIISWTKPATASSSRGNYTADKVTDIVKTNASRWLSAEGASLPQWIEIDLQQQYDISFIKFYTGYDGYNAPLKDFKFQAWDGNDWIDLLDITGNNSPKYEGGFEPYATDKVRLYITKTSDGIVRLYELEVFGIEATTDINQHNDLPQLCIHPNPALNMLHISGLTKNKTVDIFNISGHRVLNTSTKKAIDISSLQPGIYLLLLDGFAPQRFVKE